jgi:hypothetical protein
MGTRALFPESIRESRPFARTVSLFPPDSRQRKLPMGVVATDSVRAATPRVSGALDRICAGRQRGDVARSQLALDSGSG